MSLKSVLREFRPFYGIMCYVGPYIQIKEYRHKIWKHI